MSWGKASKVFQEEVSHPVHQVQARVAAGDAVVAVSVDLHVKLYARLDKSFAILRTVLIVNIIISRAVDE